MSMSLHVFLYIRGLAENGTAAKRVAERSVVRRPCHNPAQSERQKRKGQSTTDGAAGSAGADFIAAGGRELPCTPTNGTKEHGNEPKTIQIR